MTSRLQSITGRLSRAQLVAITQVEVHAPSDAPGRWGAIHRLSASRADQGVWKSNLGQAQDRLDVAESALAEASNVVSGALERAVQLASETYGPEDRANAVVEIALMRDSLITLANTRLGERALFAGDATDGSAFNSAGLYTGAAATGQVKIGAQETVDATFDGSAIFQGGTDVFATLDALSTALAANDAAGINASIDALTASHSQLVSARQSIGFDQMRVTDALGAVSELEALLDERLTSAVGADPAESYSELVSLQTSYESALQVVAASSGAKLFDFLR